MKLDFWLVFHCKRLRDGMGLKGKGDFFFFKLTFLKKKTFLTNVNLYYLTDLV